MKRRQLLRYVGLGTLAAMGGILLSPQSYQAQNSPRLEIEWLGHTAFLFKSNENRVLVNPFRPIGCTAGYPAPEVNADLVMISSQLFDEGGGVANLPNDPRVLFESGSYQFQGMNIEGIRMPHDREGGRRFGTNIAWKWEQAGVKILHLGGAAAPLETEDRILMGRPDVLILPVGGSPKAYTPELAKQAMERLRPRLVIPSHYLTEAADEENCDLVGVEEFTNLLEGTPYQQVNKNVISFTANDLPEQTEIRVMNSEQLLVGNNQ
ncbi:MAG: MBL fold metallo-hydrolase [Halothece sp.]